MRGSLTGASTATSAYGIRDILCTRATSDGLTGRRGKKELSPEEIDNRGLKTRSDLLLSAALLLDTRSFPETLTLVVKPGPADLASTQHLHGLDARRMDRVGQFYAEASMNTPNRKRAACPTPAFSDHKAVQGLHAFAAPFNDAEV